SSARHHGRAATRARASVTRASFRRRKSEPRDPRATPIKAKAATRLPRGPPREVPAGHPTTERGRLPIAAVAPCPELPRLRLPKHPLRVRLLSSWLRRHSREATFSQFTSLSRKFVR